MLRKKLGLLLASGLLCAGAGLRVHAQETPDYRPVTLTLEAGTTGPGGAVTWRFGDHLGVRGGADYIELSDTRTIKDVSYDATLRLLSEPLTLNIYPWARSSFHVSVGAMFNQNRLTGTSTAMGDQTITLNGETFTASDVGTLHLKVEQWPVNPYLSIGGNLFYFDRAHRWAFAGELGVVYTGDPDVSLTRTGGTTDPAASVAINSALAEERGRVESAARDARFWPIVKVAVSYSF